MGDRASYDPPDYTPATFDTNIQAVLATEFSEQFADLMRRRMVISFFQYGYLKDGYPERVNAVESLRLRLARYDVTGNVEYLVDVANLAMIEFMHPAERAAHFTATDSDGSPGRVTVAGEVTHRNNQDPVAARLAEYYTSHPGD